MKRVEIQSVHVAWCECVLIFNIPPHGHQMAKYTFWHAVEQNTGPGVISGQIGQ